MTNRQGAQVPGLALRRAHQINWGTLLLLSACAYVVLYFGWLFAAWPVPSTPLFSHGLVRLPIKAVAMALLWRASWHPAVGVRPRLAWRLCAAAYLLLSAGDLLSAWLPASGGALAALPDVSYMACYPLLLCGLLLFPAVPRTRSENRTLVLDAGTVLIGVGMVAWYIAHAGAGHQDPMSALLALAYPLADLMLLCVIATTLLSQHSAQTRPALRLIAIGALLLISGDFAFSYTTINGGTQQVISPAPLWMLGHLLIAASGALQYATSARQGRVAVDAPARSGTIWLPYVAIGIGYGLLLAVARSAWTQPLGGLIVGAGVLTALGALRQLIVERANARMLAQRAVDRSEARFRSLVQNATDAILVVADDGAVTYQTPSVAALLSPTPATGRVRITDLVHPDDVAELRALLAALGGRSGPFDWKLRDRSGHAHEFEVLANDQRRDPNVAGLVLTLRDIGERRRSEAAQRQSNAQFRALFEHAAIGIAIVDLSGHLQRANTAMQRLLGYSTADLQRLTFGDITHPDDLAADLAHFDDLVAGRSDHYQLEKRYWHRTGRLIWARLTASLVRDAADRPSFVIGMVEDITEHHRAAQTSAAFSALGQRLSAATTAEDAARIVASVADELLSWDAYILDLYCADDNRMRAVLAIDVVNGMRVEVPPTVGPFVPSITAQRTLAEGAQLILPATPAIGQTQLREFGDTARPSAALMFVPIRSGQRGIGLLSIQSYTPLAYSEADLATLQALADHCGGALERTRGASALRESERQHATLLSNLRGMAYRCRFDAERTVEFASQGCAELTGYTADELLGAAGSSLLRLVHPEDARTVREGIAAAVAAGKPYQLIYRIITADGGEKWVWEQGRGVADVASGTAVLEGFMTDITDRKQAEATITQMAYYDALTGLPNRALFHDRLQHALQHAQRDAQQVALLFLDIDRFKVINDSLGHDIGDRLLQALAARLAGCVRESDTVARMGGDEFTIILPTLNAVLDAAEVAERVLAAFATPVTIDAHELVVTPSIGISLFPDDGTTAETLLKQADTAMYRAKEYSRNIFQFFAPAMNAAASIRLEMEQQLRRALERDEFEVYYQPRSHLKTGTITGMEALIRWRHPDLGLVSPDEFIPLAEETGLIVPIGEWVLRTACKQARAWQLQGLPALRVAVNLAARQLQQPDLPAMVAETLRATGLSPSALELEITESNAMQDAAHTMAVLRELKRMGVQLALDDFGTGYSSLSYLKQFPIDRLKIDKSFIQDLTLDGDNAAIAAAVIALAQSLRLSVTAEGVETEAQRAFLAECHCDEMQGYLLSRPLPADQFAALFGPVRAGPEVRLSTSGAPP